ncbi:hypothetical protein X744_30710 [Mesorhizobium sp. LNJC372A00]|nr:hypothetical protein X767_33020 [Mesorhizobium sp. LSJC264A00]ESY43207.1 hypothetical protein X745_32195 [Mesorhizobium sp. LNJC374B00]ESY51770.1 hypothetical protein X744_30710 [Mesorhizobium sp. LNJC372A00]
MAGRSASSERAVLWLFPVAFFTQDARGEERDAETERLASETLRFMNYLTPQLAWTLDGYLQHQYTQRYPLTAPTVMLPLATDIQTPATAALRDDHGSELPLMGWRFYLSPAHFELGFLRQYLKKALAPADNGEARPTALRSIYEPLADLILAVDRGSAELVLQRWAYEADARAGACRRRAAPSPQTWQRLEHTSAR